MPLPREIERQRGGGEEGGKPVARPVWGDHDGPGTLVPHEVDDACNDGGGGERVVVLGLAVMGGVPTVGERRGRGEGAQLRAAGAEAGELV